MLSLSECLSPLPRESRLRQCSFYNTNLLLKNITMSCALARSLQTGLVVHAMLPTANSPVMACSPLESPQVGTGQGFQIQVLPSEISACQPPPPLLVLLPHTRRQGQLSQSLLDTETYALRHPFQSTAPCPVKASFT